MMRRPPRILLPRKFTTASTSERRSFGFSGAGFLGCYHAGVSACLHRHGFLPHPDDDTYSREKIPLLTGVSAGSMIAAANLAGVNPEQDGMEVVLEAARRTRELSRQTKQNQQQNEENKSLNFGISLDVLTPGFSLIDQVEGPFRDAMVKALGGYCQKDQSGNVTIHDIDPELFARRFPNGSLRIGLTDRRGLRPHRILDSYRYVDTYRNIEDVIACSMLSSYLPGITGPLNLKDKLPEFLGGLLNSGIMGKNNDAGNTNGVDASDRAGLCLKEMTRLGLVKHGKTGLPTVEYEAQGENDEDTGDDVNKSLEPAYYWDGGIADVFPTIDENTVVVSPVSGLFDPNPSICPRMPDEESDAPIDERGEDSGTQATISSQSNALLQQFLRPYLPTTFRHCSKSRLGLNSKNAYSALKMTFSSDDEELYSRFREGYDDARRYLDDSGQLRVFSG